jgi:GTP-binding protein YchF
MSFSLGIVGLPNVGKSTLFKALTKKQVDASNYPFCTIDPNVGVVAVPDERLEKLAILSKSKKIVPTTIEFVDIAGLVSGAAEGEGLGNKFLTHIREVNAICHIVRAFENENITHVAGKPDPLRDLEIIKTELALKDLETIEKAKDNAQREAKKGKKEDVENLKMLTLLEKELQTGSPTSDIRKSDFRILTRQYQLLSFKPYIVVFNISKKNVEIPPLSNSIAINIGEENDISAMSDEDQKELGVKSGLTELIKAAYKLLGLITFFTTGEDETRAWTIPAGSTAKRAGHAIHSDFEEKFIRADIIFWEKLLEAKSWSKAHDQGLLRSESKEYIVQNGDVIEFKI